MTIDKTLQTIIELDQKHYLNCFGTRPPLCIRSVARGATVRVRMAGVTSI